MPAVFPAGAHVFALLQTQVRLPLLRQNHSLVKDKEKLMKKMLSAMLVGLFAVTPVIASEELAKSKNCMTCHTVAKKIVGPSYKEIAAKRVGEAGAEAALAAKIKNGSKDEWGKVPMPANAVSDAEALALAKWVLSQK
jgi:cytochrome c